jgi:hypothetical protein
MAVARAHVVEPIAASGGRVVRLRVIGGELELREGVPATRADCPPRPCGHVRCKWHLWLVLGDEQRGTRREGWRLPRTTLRPVWVATWPLPPTCVLDVAEKVAAERDFERVDELAAAYGLRPSWFRATIARAKAKLAAGAADPEALIEALADKGAR